MEELFSKKVTFLSGKGEEVTLDAVYQDTHPSGGARMTVIAQAGAPGSHKDFKYIVPGLVEKNIRFIGINHPGHGYTSFHKKLDSSNQERNNFVISLLKELELSETDLIFMGHSRGAENSLQLGVMCKERTVAVVQINPPPTVKTKTFSRNIRLIRVCTVLKQYRITRPVVYKCLDLVYNKVLKLRVPSGEMAAIIMESIPTLAFEQQMEYVDAIANDKKIRLLFAYSASDNLISQRTYEHAESRLGDRRQLVYKTDPLDETENLSIGREIAAEFEEGNRIVSALFETNGHHLNKHRAGCIAEAIDGIVRWYERTGTSNNNEDSN